jgi:tetratricopeptide (TPR) repeat protein
LRALEKSTPAALNHGENLSRIRVLIGRALAGQKQYAQAATTLKNALAVLPKNSASRSSTQKLLAQTLAAKADDEEKRGKLQDAATTWGAAAALFPDNPFAYAQRARLLEGQGNAREALQQYGRALKLAPRDPNLLLRTAILEEKTGDAASALAQWKSLIEAHSEYAPAYFNLARVSVKLQQLPAQMKYLETRLGKNPDMRAPYDAVLAAGEKSGQGELARDWVSAMAKKYPKAAAPRNALIAFDRSHSPAKPEKTPAPTPTSTPVPKPTTAPTNVAPTHSGAAPVTAPAPKPLITSPAAPNDEPRPAEQPGD